MTLRSEAMFVSTILVVMMLVGAMITIALVGDHDLLIFLGWAGLMLLLRRAYLRSLYCPGCGVRLADGLFRAAGFYQPLPRPDCWNCGALLTNVDAAAAARAPAVPTVPTGRRHRNAFTWRAIIVFVVIWNALFFLHGPLRDTLQLLFSALSGGAIPAPESPSVGFDGAPLPALFFAFAFSAATLVSPVMQRFVLRPGRTVAEVRQILFLVLAVSGLMMLINAAEFAPLLGLE